MFEAFTVLGEESSTGYMPVPLMPALLARLAKAGYQVNGRVAETGTELLLEQIEPIGET